MIEQFLALVAVEVAGAVIVVAIGHVVVVVVVVAHCPLALEEVLLEANLLQSLL